MHMSELPVAYNCFRTHVGYLPPIRCKTIYWKLVLALVISTHIISITYTDFGLKKLKLKR